MSAQVVAPVPWFPFKSSLFRNYAKYADIGTSEERFGIEIHHPRYLTIPKVGMSIAPWLMAQSCMPLMRKICSSGRPFNIIDAHYFYPDGVAATILGRKLNVPVVITARGTDINLIPKHVLPCSQILWAARHASAIITVSNALKNRLLDLGVDETKITVLRNGVDLDCFSPVNQTVARRTIGDWRGKWLLSIGHLIERKGHHLIIEALKYLPEIQLAIIGEGPLERQLEEVARTHGVTERVSFLGPVEQTELKHYYSAADALVLASSREGMANVLLESLACGLPTVATPFWGNPEVICQPEAGILTQSRSSAAIASAVEQLLANYPDRTATRKYAEQFSWDSTTNGQLRIFQSILNKSQ